MKAICSDQYIQEPDLNKHAEQVRENIGIVFDDYILPHRNQEFYHFTPDHVGLYEQYRYWQLKYAVNIRKGKFRYERAFDKIFWAGSGNPPDKSRIIFLTGTVGSGKSTFIEYYMRCFCRENNDRGVQKLNIHIDIKGCIETSELYEKIYYKTKDYFDHLEYNTNYFPDFSHGQRAILDLFKCISDNNRSKKLTITFDNVDQSPEEIQDLLLNISQYIVEETSKEQVYMIILPMWPKTLSRYKAFDKIRIKPVDFVEFELGPLYVDRVIARRLGAVKRLMIQVDSDHLRSFARKFMKKMGNDEFRLINNLCYNNLRTLMNVISEILISHNISSYCAQYAKIRDYQFYDTLICGACKTHNKLQSRILNPFFSVSQIQERDDILIGIYLLEYIKLQEYLEEDVYREFSQLGFRWSSIDETLRAFERHHILHVETGSDKRRILIVHNKVRSAYKKLLKSPAAIDNFAQVTPIFDSIGEARPTVGYDDADFKDRVLNTKMFIEEFRNIEVRFHHRLEERIKEEGLVFGYRPELFHGKLREKYYSRLEHLFHLGSPDRPEINLEFWKEALGYVPVQRHKFR